MDYFRSLHFIKADFWSRLKKTYFKSYLTCTSGKSTRWPAKKNKRCARKRKTLGTLLSPKLGAGVSLQWTILNWCLLKEKRKITWSSHSNSFIKSASKPSPLRWSLGPACKTPPLPESQNPWHPSRLPKARLTRCLGEAFSKSSPVALRISRPSEWTCPIKILNASVLWSHPPQRSEIWAP